MKIYLDAYLAKNLGDDLFINLLLNRYPQHEFIALSRGEEYKYTNLKIHKNVILYKAMKKYKLEKIIANRCDLVVTIGGSMYMESNDSKKNFSLGKNKRYIMGINFGPYYTQEYFNNLKNVFRSAEDVCFREKYSYELFKELPNVRYAPDILFNMNIDNIEITNRKRAIISVISCSNKMGDKYTEKYEEKMVEIIKFLISKGYEICLMSFCKQEGDEEAINSIREKLSEERKCIQTYLYNGNINEALSVIADSSLIIGSRFHANILGLLFGKPILPVVYSEKTSNVIKEMNLDVKIIDIKEIENFDVISITDEDLNKVNDVTKYTTLAKEQFEKLDKEIGCSN